MFKSFQVAGSAALTMLSMSLLLANGVSTAASAQVQSFQAPVIVAPDVATPVEPIISKSSIEDAPDAAAPAEGTSDSLAELVGNWQDDGAFDADERCLATAIFFESKSESLEGQLAVANVVLARAQSGRFAKTACGVVTQRGQFGFVRGGRLPDVPESSAQWRTAKAIAQIALDGSWKNPVEGALFFHATYSNANWDRPTVAKIGRHVFYR
jgi:spore germination cell wall hydrolase CwlJ-like protein